MSLAIRPDKLAPLGPRDNIIRGHGGWFLCRRFQNGNNLFICLSVSLTSISIPFSSHIVFLTIILIFSHHSPSPFFGLLPPFYSSFLLHLPPWLAPLPPLQPYYTNRATLPPSSGPRGVPPSSGPRPVTPTHVYQPGPGSQMMMIPGQQLPFPSSPQGPAYFIPGQVGGVWVVVVPDVHFTGARWYRQIFLIPSL